jgi:G:T/U-mismatch repair DNA glycosylase
MEGLEKFRFVSGFKRSRESSLPNSNPANVLPPVLEAPPTAIKPARTIVQKSMSVDATTGKRLAVQTPPRDGALPFVSNFVFRGMQGKWRERYASICPECFGTNDVCAHFPELPLRCVLVGHNPSEHAFQSGFFYSNPTNRMWGLLTGTFGTGKPFPGLVPANWLIQKQNDLPLHCGIGLTDLGVEPGNDAAAYSYKILLEWRTSLFASLKGHTQRCKRTILKLQSIANGSEKVDDINAETASAILQQLSRLTHPHVNLCEPGTRVDEANCEPKIVAFTGKAQWKTLFEPPLKSVAGIFHLMALLCLLMVHLCRICDTGFQPDSLRPPRWPYSVETKVFVLPSSSGRAAMTDAARREPYECLAKHVHELPWLSDSLIPKLGPWKRKFPC